MTIKSYKILVALLAVLLAASAVLSGWLYVFYESPDELAAREQANQLSSDLDRAQGTITEYTATMSSLREQLSDLEANLADKLEKIDQLEVKVSILLDEETASDAYQQLLLDEIAKMKAEAEQDREQIAELSELISNYENITTLNFGIQAKKISDLLMKVAETNRPERIKTTEEVDPETGETIVHEETLTSNVSFYYRDLETGYTISYESDNIMYAASLVKVPYVYTMLKTVSDFEYNKMHFDAEGNPLYDEEGQPLFEGAHPNLDEEGRIVYLEGEEKYDLSRIWTFNKEEMMVEGSGVIQKMDDGTQLTYLELALYALQHSDNIAFAEIRKMFGYTEYLSTARAMGVRGSSHGYMKLSADDCGIFLSAIYDFTETNERYGALMKEAMIGSNYPVLIPAGVSPTVAAHKYGWDEDSYHDMGIVYDEHPYILVIMTDLDEGSSKEIVYVRDIVRSLHAIHRNFYSNK